MKIAICEDNIKDEQFLRTTLEKLLETRRLSYSLISFASGEQMLAALEREVFHLSFIDIYLGEVDGVTLARKIRGKSKFAAIVFTTTSKEFMTEGYELGVIHYLTKPFKPSDVNDALERGLRELHEEKPYSKFTINRLKEIVLHQDIKYIESQNRCCVLNTITGEKAVYGKLDTIESKLDDPRFLRCHRSFLVNMDNVMQMSKESFLLFSKEEIPIARNKISEMRAVYAKYRVNKVREEDIKWSAH